jgi:hypothetical protein
VTMKKTQKIVACGRLTKESELELFKYMCVIVIGENKYVIRR